MRLCVVSTAAMWAVVLLVLLGVTVKQPTSTEAAAAPHFCCRKGRFAAAALGFIGGYLVGRHSGYHHGGCGGCGGGCGGCYGGGCGWCGGGFYGRKRRSLDEVMEREVIEDMFEKFAAQDMDQCGLRLVCELAQKDPNYLTGDETLILLPYRGREEGNERSFYRRYDKAVWHGQRGNSCKEIFPLCLYSSSQIMGETPTNATDITY